MKKVIFFDFDGVIIDSMAVRDEGFRKIAKEVTDSEEIVKGFIKYHRYNAGLSRFVKIRHLHEEMLNKPITDEEINKFTTEFSELMKSKLTNKDILIDETVAYIKSNHDKYIFHIVSGSEQNELRYLCKELGLDEYFHSINGSPIHKNDLVKRILEEEQYKEDECLLIGDSINDYNAAKVNSLEFYGYNNLELIGKDKYIDTFKGLKL